MADPATQPNPTGSKSPPAAGPGGDAGTNQPGGLGPGETDKELYTKMCQKLHRLGCWDPHMITHSVMCGHRDPRLPKSGKLECKTSGGSPSDKDASSKDGAHLPDDLRGLYEAIEHFHSLRSPLTLCEMATPVFKYYQDVDVVLPHVTSLEEISEIEALWMECLIRCQAAVLGVIWRSHDAVGVSRAKESTLVNVFASSGYAKRYNLFKISLHFIWSELHVSAHESKAIRNANLAFVASKQCGPLHRLLANAHKGEDPTLCGTKNPWEDILDKASSEGSSLRMPFTDKALKQDKKAPTSNKPEDLNNLNQSIMEGRPKLPVACYRVQLVPGDPGKCALKPVALVKDYSRLQWLEKGSVRLPADARISAIWLPSTMMPEPTKQITVQNVNRRAYDAQGGMGKGAGGKGKGVGKDGGAQGRGKTYKGSGGSKRTKPKPRPRDETTWISENLRGYWMDDFDNVLNVWVEANSGLIKVYRGDSNMQIGTISVVDPNEFPIKLYFSEERSRSIWILAYKGDNDLQGTWKSNDGNPKADWHWRRPAVYKKCEWPRWGGRVLLNISGSVDGPNKIIALGVVINAVGVQSENPQVKQMWHGSLKLTADDLPEGSSGEVTVPMACLAASALGLRVCIDLGLDKREIMVGTDHSIVEAQFNNISRKPAPDLRPIVEVLDDYRSHLAYPVRVTQTTSSENQATEVARNCRQNGYSTVGDRRLYNAIRESVESRGNPGGLNALKQITSMNQQATQYAAAPQPAIADSYGAAAPGSQGAPGGGAPGAGGYPQGYPGPAGGAGGAPGYDKGGAPGGAPGYNKGTPTDKGFGGGAGAGKGQSYQAGGASKGGSKGGFEQQGFGGQYGQQPQWGGGGQYGAQQYGGPGQMRNY